MIAVDTNILVHAHNVASEKHEVALGSLRALAEGRARWGIPVFCLGEFLRVVTHPRVLHPPLSVDQACKALERVLASPSLVVLTPQERFLALLEEAMRQGNARGNLVFDAQVVAVCREWGVRELISEDHDFDRFPKFLARRL